MIVHKIWITRKTGDWDKFYFEGLHYRTRERHWYGYFLLGIIPLYVHNTKNIYLGR